MHFLRSIDLGRESYDEVIHRAKGFINGSIPIRVLEGRVAGIYFSQPSTRTAGSVQSSIIRAGGGWIDISSHNSMQKGESFEDTIQELSSLCDFVAIRHPDDTAASAASRVSDVPVLNCGCGTTEHAVATVMFLGSIATRIVWPPSDLKWGFYGLPRLNRCVKSLLPVLSYYSPQFFLDDLAASESAPHHDDPFAQYRIHEGPVADWISDIDVLIVTRFDNSLILKSDESVHSRRFMPLSSQLLKKMKLSSSVMMIKPRTNEIERDFDSDPRAVYAQKEPHVESLLGLVTVLLNVNVKSLP